ncbi:MAG: hypothetical protein FD165_321 [Gammaproteobacteria bacterium]|nr:MAG: hypothetical protein FD165_321 [Gammaproteobacteria bacterium]TND06900.1 MAG: hypothetical protein FD120_632 [Gammaproteobacteria bacterium]
MREFIIGAGYLLRGYRLLRVPGLRRYVVVPLLINTSLFAGIVLLGGQAFGHLIDGLLAAVPAWLQWLGWVLWPLFVITAGIVVFFTFTVIANLLGAPFNGLLAESVERYLTGESAPSSSGFRDLIASVLPAIHGELVKAAYLLLRAIPLLLLFLVPVVNAAAPFMWAIFGSWMLALEYFDYPLGNQRMAFPEQRRLVKSHRSLTLGFGGATMIASMIPVVNFVVMPAAVAGATALYVAQLRR